MPNNNNRINFQVGYNVDQASVNAVKKSLQDLQNIKLKDFSGTKTQLDLIKKTAGQVESALTKAFNVNLNSLNTQQFNTSLKEAGLSVDKIYTSFSKAGAQGQVAFSRMASEVLTTNMQLKLTNSLVSQMGETMANTVKWGIASSIMNNFTNSVQQAFQYVKSLDSALTDIRIVTGDSTEQMKEFAVQANNAAQSLGRSTMDYTKAALTFYQQGLNEEDVQARTQAVLKAQNITGAGDEMADYLTAVWNGYKVANEEAELYVDKLASVADSSASNMSLLAIAMSKVASTANAMGVDVDQLNAQIATIVATTRQAPESVGNALKTIYSRINDISTGAEGAEVSLGNYSKQMAAVGFSVLDTNGNLRDTGEVIEEIGGKWADLSREEQIYLARTMAGQRQYNNLIALFDNWSRYSDLVNVSMDSQGTLMEKNSRYMESLGAKMEQLGAAGERVKSAMINEEDLKGLVDFGTGAVNLFGSLIESIGGGRGALLAFGSTFVQLFSGTIAKELNNVVTNMQNVRNNAQLLANDVKSIQDFGVSQGYEKGIIKEMVDAKEEISKYYSVMNTLQINSYNNIIKEIAASKELVLILNEQVSLAEAFKTAISNAANEVGNTLDDQLDITIDQVQDLRETLNGLSGREGLQVLKDETVFDDLVLQIRDLEDALGEGTLPAFSRFEEILQNISNPAYTSTESLRDLRLAALAVFNQAYSKTDLIINLDLTKQKAKLVEYALKLIQEQAKNSSLGYKQLFNITQMTRFVSSVGQIASGISNIINLTKIWKDENLSAGEKLTQIITNIGFTIPMLASAISNINKALGITQLRTQKRYLILKQITLLKEKQLLLEERSNSLGSKHSAEKLIQIRDRLKEIEDETALIGNKMDLLPSIGELIEGKFASIGSSISKFLTTPLIEGASFLTGGFVVAVGVAAVAIGVTLYKAWNKAADAAKKAALNTKQAQEVYNNITLSYKNLKSSLDDLASAKDHFSELTKGTQEWRDALLEVNEKVLNLIQEFPELAQYLSSTEDGLLTLSEDGLQAVREAYQQKTIASGLNYAQLNQLSTRAENRSAIVDLSRELDDFGPWGLTPDLLLQVINAINLHGTQILENTETLSKYASISEKDAKVILDSNKENTSKVIDLANQIQASTIASLNLTSSLIQANLNDNLTYQNSNNQAEIAKIIENELSNILLDDKYHGFQAGLGGSFLGIDLEAVAKAYSNYTGEQVKAQWDILGGHYEKFDLTTQKWKKISALSVLGLVAYRDAVQNMDLIVSLSNQTIDNIKEKFGFAANAALDALINGVLNLDISKISSAEIQGLISRRTFLSELTGLEVSVITEALNGYLTQISLNTRLYIGSLPSVVQEAFNNINTSTLSTLAQKVIGTMLEEAFVKDDTKIPLLTLLFSGLKSLDILPFELLINSIDFSDLSVDDFRSALSDAGIELEATYPKLLTFIEYMKGIAEIEIPNPLLYYKSIHDIIDGLKIGDTIDAEQAAILEQAGILLSQYFDRFPDGTLKLRQSVEDFVNYANNVSLQPLVDKLNSLSEDIALRENFENSQYSSSNGQNFSLFSLSASNAEMFSAQLAFLQGIDLLTPLIISKVKELQTENVNWNELTELQKKLLEEVSQAVYLNEGKWRDNAAAIEEAKNQVSTYEELLGNASRILETLDVDVDLDQWEDLSEYLQDYADQLEEVSDNVQDNLLVANELAESLLRYDHALEEVIDHQDEWLKMLNSDAIQDRVEAGNLLQGVYADLLDLPFESLSPDFTQDINNFNLLKAAVQGDELAYNQLAEAARQDIIAHIELKDADAFYNLLNNVQSMMDQMNFQDILIGAVLDDTNFIAGLLNMVNAAGMTAQQATDYLASMGVDALVIENNAPSTEEKETTGWTTTLQPVDATGTAPALMGPGFPVQVPIRYRTYQAVYTPQIERTTSTSDNKAVSLKVTSAHKSSGGGFKHRNATHGGGSKAPRSTGGGGGSKGSTPKAATQAKVNTAKIETTAKTPDHNPYEQELKSYLRQSKILDELQDQLKKLVNKDRLKNLQEQNKTLKEQEKILNRELDISKNQAYENSTADYARRLGQLFKDALSFDADGQISDVNKLEQVAAENYNAAAKAAVDAFNKLKLAYNNYILNTWNAYGTQDEQELHKAEKEMWDQRLKEAELNSKNAIKAAEEEYKTREDLINSYTKAWEADQKRLELIKEIQDLILENQIAASKIKVDLAIDTGEFERDWLDFRNKVIKKLDKDDYFGNAKANAKELMSYFDSLQIQKTASEIEKIRNEIAIMKAGGPSSIYSIVDEEGNIVAQNLAQAEEDLKHYMDQQMEDLLDIQNLSDDIMLNYLDALDDVKDKMDDRIDQYERINDLVEHNIKLTLMLYGDKAYDTMEKYYEYQKDNNQDILNSLRSEQLYWQTLLSQETRGSDAWKQIKENLDDVTDNLNSKLEDMIENLSDQWLNRVNGIIAKLNNALTGGRGLDYLDEQWDYINNFDDNFLDTFESNMGIQEVTDLYQLAIDGLSGSPANQQKINKLMNEQLKILREKDNLTQYDIDRAKAALEVEKARMALEDTRYNKTKMRLRRDSQGNYTYQYVADEEKLGDLQAALADAQANLYNMDKEHYTLNLNTLYDAYKDYIDKMRELTEEYNNTQDAEERARIQARIDLLRLSTNNLMQGLTEDNKYALQYLNESFFGGMGIDTTLLSADEQMEIMNQNIPQMQSNIQDLADTLVGEGGILNATNDAMKQISDATIEYDKNVKQFLSDAGTSLEVVTNVTDAFGNALDKNVLQALNLTGYYTDLINQSVDAIVKIQEVLNTTLGALNTLITQDTIDNLAKAYNLAQLLNGVGSIIENNEYLDKDKKTLLEQNKNKTFINDQLINWNLNTDTSGMNAKLYQDYLNEMSKQNSLTVSSKMLDTISNLDIEKIQLQDLKTIVNTIQAITDNISSIANQDIDSIMSNASGYIGNINNVEQLDQNVHIEANFPNVTQHTEIEQAFNNLVNMASMRASGYRD